MCRESMIISLVKTASELEVYAREFEVSCSNLDQLLRPTFEHYKMEPPPLPAPLPLTAYPLDFQPPEGKRKDDLFRLLPHSTDLIFYLMQFHAFRNHSSMGN